MFNMTYSDFPRGISHDKIIVFDVDDTISVHEDRKYEEAKPITEMINKINSLYDLGYGIVLLTARGQLSMDGNTEKIEAERRPVLEAWLARHNVKYDKLLFTKPLGILYVDDKAATPEDFLKMKFETLTGGSGSKVYREGNRVIKTCSNAKEQYDWYKEIESLISEDKPEMLSSLEFPKVHSLVQNTLNMDFVGAKDALRYPVGEEANAILKSAFGFIGYCKLKLGSTSYRNSFRTYISRVESHLALFTNKDQVKQICSLMEDAEALFDQHKSFCHGDLTLGNLRWTDYSLFEPTCYIIDPNTPKGVYTSYLLDIGKLKQSIEYGYEELFGFGKLYDQAQWKKDLKACLELFTPEEQRLADIACLTHWVRLRKYRNPGERIIVDRVINTILKKLA
jgi:capsule biosynthesis phosphatase